MNATSSRAHTVVTITFDQIMKNEGGQETKKSSSINLVDLAGNCVILQYIRMLLFFFGLPNFVKDYGVEQLLET